MLKLLVDIEVNDIKFRLSRDHFFAVNNEFELDFYKLPSGTINSSDQNLKYVNQD